MDGVIPGQATYGDFAVLWRGDVLDLLVSGLSVIHPFTMRIRFVQGTFQSAKVLVSTRAPSAPPPGTGGGNLPRGVASSADGTVVTTMPISGSGEFVYLFNVDFPEAGAGLPAQVLGGSLSSGMTWHPDGTFYTHRRAERYLRRRPQLAAADPTRRRHMPAGRSTVQLGLRCGCQHRRPCRLHNAA
jgi:hypothetical protein